MKNHPEIRIGIPDPADWRIFLRLAALEGWRVPARELAWYQEPGPGCAFVLRRGSTPLGFVTVMAHDRSGWIGNLVVAAELRGQGLGRLLFRHALGFLETIGLSRVWLTASAAGQPLYESFGFRTVDRVERWTGRGTGQAATVTGRGMPENRWRRLLDLDRRAWGEDRSRFLDLLRCNSRLLQNNSFLLQQQDGFCQIGPWYGVEPDREVLRQALALVAAGEETVADVPVSTSVRDVLGRAGFAVRGEVGLMVRDSGSPEEPRAMLALASLGSAG